MCIKVKCGLAMSVVGEVRRQLESALLEKSFADSTEDEG